MVIPRDERMKRQLLGLLVVLVVGLLLLPFFWSRQAHRPTDGQGLQSSETAGSRVELPIEAMPAPDESLSTEMGLPPVGNSLAQPPAPVPPAPQQPAQEPRVPQPAAPSPRPAAPAIARQQQPQPQARRVTPAAPGPQQAAPADQATSGYAVQVAALADPAKAHAMAVRLSEAGFPASVSPVHSGNKTLYRVRVGQVSNKAVAEALRQRLFEARGLRGQVVSNP